MPQRLFSKPRRPHVLSRLMHLPAEVRLLILRYVLRSDEPIRPFGYFESPNVTSEEALARYKANIALSSQMLRCCQQLFVEGEQVLYHDNILAVAQLPAEHHLQYPDRIEIFDIHVPVVGSVFEFPRVDFDLLYDVGGGYYEDYNECETFTGQTTMGHSILDTISRFREYHVSIDCTTVQNVAFVGRMLAKMLQDKDVTLNLSGGVPNDISKNLTPLQFLQCRSVNITGLSDDDIANVKCMVTTQPVKDVFGMWQSFEEDVVDDLRDIDNDSFRTTYDDQRARLMYAAIRYDIPACDQLGRDLLRSATNWVSRWRQWKDQEALRDQDWMNGQITGYRDEYWST